MRLKTNITCLADLEYWVEEDEDIFFRKAHVEIDEQFEHLPKRENRKEYLTRVYGNMWDLNKFDHSWYWKIPYWKKINQIIDKNVGKSFDLTFSYICKKFDIQFQKYFLDSFDGYYRHKFNNHYIDDNGLIQETKVTKLKKEIYLYNYILATTDDLRIHPYKCILGKNLITGIKFITFKCKDYQYYRAKAIFLSKAKKLARQEKLRKTQIDYKAILKERKHE